MAEAKKDQNRVSTLLAVSDVDSTTPLVIEGDAANAALNVAVVTGGTSGTEYTEDVASSAPSKGSTKMGIRDDQLSAVTPIEGDWVPSRVTSLKPRMGRDIGSLLKT